MARPPVSRILLAAGLLSISVLPAGGAAATAGADPLPPVGSVFVGITDDVTTSGRVPVIWAGPPGTTYDVETAGADSLAPVLGSWTRRVTDGEPDGRYVVTVRPGRVLCARVRFHSATDDAGWRMDCIARARDDRVFRVVGAHADVRTRTSGGHATELLRGSALLVPGLRDGMRVAATYTAGRSIWWDYDVARWRGPDGEEQRIARGDPFSNLGLEYAVRGSGTGRFFTGPGGGTRPVGGVAILPEWFPFADEGRAPDPGDATTYAPDGVSLGPASDSILSLSGSIQLAWTPSVWSDVTPEVQVGVGSVLGARPAWRARVVPTSASALRLSVRNGRVLCARVRFVHTSGRHSPWSGPQCVIRAIDDSRVPQSGRFLAASDPASADGRSRRMRGGARMWLRHLPAGSRFGYAFYEEAPVDGAVRPWPVIRVDGVERFPEGWSWWGVGPGHPSGWYATVRRDDATGTLSLPREWSGQATERIFGVFVIPRWAR